jgi:hypothetical protein
LVSRIPFLVHAGADAAFHRWKRLRSARH